MKIFKRILVTIQFLTVFPLSLKGPIEPKELGKSMAYFPLAGMFIGLGLFCLYTMLTEFLSNLLTAVIVVGTWAWFTGGIHLDGFVDTSDGLGSGKDKEGILSVMKDTHCGAKGVVALVFLIILKIVLLKDISCSMMFPCLILTPVFSRWAMVCAASYCDYARKTASFGRAFVENTGIKEWLISSIILLIIGFVLMQLKFFIVMAAGLAITILFIIYFRKKIGGVTGDVLGALNEVVEVSSLSIFLLLS